MTGHAIGELVFVPNALIGSGGTQIALPNPAAATTDGNNALGAGAGAKYEVVTFHPDSGGVQKFTGTATGGTTTTLTDSGATFTTGAQAVQVGDFLVITAGPGAGQTLQVTAVTATQLTFAAVTAIPNGTTLVASRTATGGSTTTLVDTAVNFANQGVVAGSIIVTTGGAGTGQSLTVTAVSTTTNPNDTLTFATATALGGTTVYSVTGLASTYKVNSGAGAVRGMTVRRVA